MRVFVAVIIVAAAALFIWGVTHDPGRPLRCVVTCAELPTTTVARHTFQMSTTCNTATKARTGSTSANVHTCRVMP